MTEEMLKPVQVAASLGLSTGRVYELVRGGDLPHVRIGNAIRFPRTEWERWLAEQNRRARAALKKEGANAT